MPAGDREKAYSAVPKIIRAAIVALAVVPLSAGLLLAPAEATGEAGSELTVRSELSESRVAIAFIPGLPPKTKPPLIERLAVDRDLAIGFMSAIQGSYEPEQTLLDISAGSRVWTSLYEDDVPERIELRPTGRGGTITGWNEIRRRAKTAPADIEPGTLGDLFSGIEPVAYIGPRGSGNREAIVAADENGQVGRVLLEEPGDVGRQAVRQWRSAGFVVVKLPRGSAGAGALAELRADWRPGDLLLVIESPSALRRRLLTMGAIGLPGRGENVRSDTTRTDGLVSATDIAPTLMAHFGYEVPDQVAGEPIEASGDRSAAELTEFKDRLADIGPRRWRTVLGSLVGATLLAGLAGLALRANGRQRLARSAFLAALWLPSVLLVTGAIAPTRLAELGLVAGAAAALALATDRLVPWPYAIALPSAVAVTSHVADLALGSSLIQRSLLGPNPILGARFYGVGNELEVTLGVIGLLGIGALFARGSRRQLAAAFVIGGSAIALVLSWGKLGADVGASLMLAAGGAAAAVAAFEERSRKLRIALIVVAPLVALAALAALDIVTGGNAHFTRSVLDAGGLGELADVAQRRVELSYRSLTRGIIAPLVVLALVALVWGVRSRRRLLAPLAAAPGLRAGVAGAFVAVVVGALSNDSGPMILLIGTSYLGLGVGYFQFVPKTGAKQHSWHQIRPR
jgi:hypothetical protein